MKKAPMSFQISQYVKNNPTAKAADVAKALGTTAAYVYSVTYKMKNKVAKKPKLTSAQRAEGYPFGNSQEESADAVG